MSNPWPISPLTDRDLNFAVVAYDFTTFTAQEETELPGLETSIDLTTADLIASAADQAGLLATLFDDVLSLNDLPGEIDNFEFDATNAALAQAATDGDAMLSTYTQLIGAGSPSGGGGGGGSSSPCAVQDFGDVPQGTTKSIKINITNNSSQNITIKGLEVTGNNTANIFTLSSTYQGKVLGPAASIPLTILADAREASVQLYTSTLTVNTNQPDPQPCMTLKANVTAGTPGGGGGGGGGGDDGGGCDVGFDTKGHLGCID